MTIHEKIKQSEYLIYSDEEILIVLDYDPITKGHVLILPQNCYKDIDEIPLMILKKIFKAAQIYIRILKPNFSANGYSIMQNGGSFNDIDVFHLHVIPRFKENEFGHKQLHETKKVDFLKLRKLMKVEIEKTRENKRLGNNY